MRHKILLYNVIRPLVIMLFLIACAVGGSVGSQALTHNINQDIAEQQATKAHFYRVIAGEESDGGPTVDNQLATDLRNATDLRDFRGHSNTYGGIADAIGEDPFVSEGCQECGALTPEFRTNVEQVKNGQLDRVLAREVHTVDTSGFSATPFGLSVPTAAGLAWFFGGPLALALGHRRAMADRQNDYDVRQFGDLNWNLNGKADGHKITLVMLAPGFFVPYFAWRAARRRKFHQRVAECYASEMALVREIDRDIERLRGHGHDPKVMALREGRDDLVDEIESLTRSSDSAVDDLVSSSTDRLDYIKASLKGRKEFAAELQPGISTNVVPEVRERR
jgi:hypothetical protein